MYEIMLLQLDISKLESAQNLDSKPLEDFHKKVENLHNNEF